MQQINTREDLDAIIGTPEHDQFMAFLKGTISIKQDTAVYPEGYGQADYAGDKIEAIWTEVENLSTIESFGFSKADFQ
jgi:hypothetical protein